MKSKLNEEIGMSTQGIDYVNSLEVKEPIIEKKIDDAFIKITPKGEYIVYQILERKKLTKQRNFLFFVIVFIAIVFITKYFNK